MQATGLRLEDAGGPVDPVEFAVLLDYHDVIDTLQEAEAGVLGVDLDHLSNGREFIPCFLCSYGYTKSEAAFDGRNPVYPALEVLDGYVFTDQREQAGGKFKVYRPHGWPHYAIRVSGDKSAVSRFLNIPTLLFDDKEENIVAHASGHRKNDGVVVKRGRKSSHWQNPYFMYCSEWQKWATKIKEFQRGLQAESDIWGDAAQSQA